MRDWEARTLRGGLGTGVALTVLAAVWGAASSAGAVLPACCSYFNATGHEVEVSGCGCLHEAVSGGDINGTGVALQRVAPGAATELHWELRNFSSMDVNGTKRSVQFDVQVCTGSLFMEAHPLSPPDNAYRYNASAPFDDLSIALSLRRSHFFLSLSHDDIAPPARSSAAAAKLEQELAEADEILSAQLPGWVRPPREAARYGVGGPSDAVAYVGVFYTDEDAVTARPVPGGNGTVVVQQSASPLESSLNPSVSLSVEYTTAEGGEDLEYMILRARNRTTGARGANDGLPDLCGGSNPGSCPLRTACGALSAMVPITNWVLHPSDGTLISTVIDGLPEGQTQVFQVVARRPSRPDDPFSYTTYKAASGDASAERVSQLHSNEVLGYAGIGVAGLIVIIVVLLLVVRHRMRSTLSNHVFDSKTLLGGGSGSGGGRSAGKTQHRKSSEEDVLPGEGGFEGLEIVDGGGLRGEDDDEDDGGGVGGYKPPSERAAGAQRALEEASGAAPPSPKSDKPDIM